MRGYEKMYGRSLADPGSFWLEQAQAARLDQAPPTIAGDWSFDEARFPHQLVRRRQAERRRPTASTGISPSAATRSRSSGSPTSPREEPRRFTYRQLHAEVCRFANVLKAQGVAKGDRVTIYLPMIPEAAFAMLACARIGAIHSVVFGGFSPDALAGRIEDCDQRIVVTADEGRRGGKRIPLKANVDAAAERAPASSA